MSKKKMSKFDRLLSIRGSSFGIYSANDEFVSALARCALPQPAHAKHFVHNQKNAILHYKESQLRITDKGPN
jgi:hypothetical protein